MIWLSALPSFLIALTLLFLPGLVAGFLIGLRRLWLFALAPAISITTVGAAALLLPLLGIAWHPLSFGLFAAAFILLIFVLFRFLLRQDFRASCLSNKHSPITTILSVVVPYLLLAILAMVGIGAPSNISQTFDNIFHLNLVQFIVDTQDASPLHVGQMTARPGAFVFYPDVWHAFVSLVSTVSASTVSTSAIPVAVNAANAALLFAWPLGIVLLTRQLLGDSRSVTIATGIFAAAFPAMPLNLMYYGVLYPFMLSLILLPTVLAVFFQILGVGQMGRFAHPLALWVLLVGLLPGIVLGHPSVFMALLALTVPATIYVFFADFKTGSALNKLVRLFFLIVYLLFGLTLLLFLRPGESSAWGSRVAPLRGLKQTFLLNFFEYGFPITLAALLLFGLVRVFKLNNPARITILGMWIIGALLFFVSASVPFWRFRYLTTGVWYSDYPRLTAIYVITIIPLLVLATVTIIKWIKTKTLRVTFFVALFLVALLGAGYSSFTMKMQRSYAFSENAALISSDEHALLELLPEIVPENTVIVGSPWTGTSLAYAFSNREVLLPHVFSHISEDGELILESLNDSSAFPALCEIITNQDIFYVLDFGEREVHGGTHVYEGLTALEMATTVELIEQVGEAKLFKVTACNVAK